MNVISGHKSAELRVLDIHKNEVVMDTLWAEGPTLLYFHSNLGSAFTKQTFTRLDYSAAQLESHGVKLISIVPTSAENTAQFYYTGSFWHSCYADPACRSYRKFNVPKVGLRQLASLAPLVSTLRAYKHGYKHSYLPKGRLGYLPTVVVVDGTGHVLMTRTAKYLGEIPSISELKKICIDVSDMLVKLA